MVHQTRLAECRSILEEAAQSADADPVWPTRSWAALETTGVLTWGIDPSFGGQGCDAIEILTGFETIATGCATTAFLLSQREAAVRRIADQAAEPLRGELLRPLARGETFATVGLSQLTTSRQHGRPVLTARQSGADFVLNGKVPWVTGASRANHFVIGASLDDGKQILFVLPATANGLTVGPPFDLMALQGSMTAELSLDDVHVEQRWLLAGPAEKVLSSRRGGAGGLETSCLALGLAGAAIEYLAEEAKLREDLRETAERFECERREVRSEMHRLAIHGGEADVVAGLRTRANDLVLRATQAALLTAKGAGFLRSHPAQRWARQALFFLVWSCPRPTVLATLAQLTPVGTCETF